jgi:hypothetical protein
MYKPFDSVSQRKPYMYRNLPGLFSNILYYKSRVLSAQLKQEVAIRVIARNRVCVTCQSAVITLLARVAAHFEPVMVIAHIVITSFLLQPKAPVCINPSIIDDVRSERKPYVCKNLPGLFSNILYHKPRVLSAQLDAVLLWMVSCLTILTEAKCKRFATTVTRLLSSFLFR